MRLLTLVVVLAGCGEVVDNPFEGGFLVSAEPASVFVRRGETQTVTVTVARDDGFDADITFTVPDLPTGVTTNTLVIAGSESTGMLIIDAADAAEQGAVDTNVSGVGGGNANDAALRLLVGGPPGTVDESFAGDGTFTTTVPGMVLISRALALTDAGIVVTGSTATQAIAARIDGDGDLDTSFGGAGFVSTGTGAFSEGIAVAPLGDGSIVVAGIAGGPGGSGDNDFGIFKYSAAGELDTTFGNSGVAAFDPGAGTGELHTIAVESSGSLIVAGDLFASPLVGRALRFSAAGVRDNAYSITETDALIEASLLQADGKLVLAGAQGGDFWIARYNANASRDNGFGTNGIAIIDFGEAATASSVIAVTGGKLLVVGIATPVGAPLKHVVVARLNANGSPDLAFGVGGKVSTTLAFDTRSPNSAILDGNGRIVIVGAVTNVPSVARLLPDGTPDSTFGIAGIASVDFGVAGTTVQTGGYGIGIDSDGRIIFAGEVGPSGGQQMAVSRLWP
ncbi:MAG: hypothetical protein ABI867_10685 [Kofleriaceae bacterium]